MGIFSIFGSRKAESSDPDMKYLITGLGNPGPEYHYNRHNIGFRVLDRLAQQNGIEFASDRHGYTCTLRHKGRQLVLLKPTTFMNLSGKAVRHHLQQHKLLPAQLLVLTDDISLPFGKLRMRPSGSAGGHNGLTNIETLLGTRDYPRLRMGVGNDFSKGRQADYVLSDFPSGEEAVLDPILEKAGEMVLAFATIGIERTMSQFNG